MAPEGVGLFNVFPFLIEYEGFGSAGALVGGGAGAEGGVVVGVFCRVGEVGGGRDKVKLTFLIGTSTGGGFPGEAGGGIGAAIGESGCVFGGDGIFAVTGGEVGCAGIGEEGGVEADVETSFGSVGFLGGLGFVVVVVVVVSGRANWDGCGSWSSRRASASGS